MAAVLMAALPLPLRAAPVEVYQGTLGTQEVVLELGASPGKDEPRQGRYFYRRHGVDIPLRGDPGSLAEALPLREIPDNDITHSFDLVFEDPATQQPRRVWKGQLAGDTYAGTWRDARCHRTLPFTLKRVARYDPERVRPEGVEAVTTAIVQGTGSGVSGEVPISRTTTPYDFLRVDVALQPGPEKVSGSVGYRMVSDPRTHIAYPRLTRHPDPRMLAQANRQLEQRHWAMNLAALACMSTLYTERGPSAGTLGNYEEERITVDYLSPAMMSVVESGSLFCGGAHPHNHFDPYTLDLLRGGYVDFARLLRGVDRTPEGLNYSEAFMRFVRKGATPDTLSCAETWPSYLALHFIAPDQLAFDVSGVGHAEGACLGTHVTRSFAALKPMLKPEAARYLEAR